jgi:hypothetical protein
MGALHQALIGRATQDASGNLVPAGFPFNTGGFMTVSPPISGRAAQPLARLAPQASLEGAV